MQQGEVHIQKQNIFSSGKKNYKYYAQYFLK
jgi:hypothetical protein